VAGFGSNAFSSNAGLESLGLVCAAGIAFSFLTAFFLLPVWWNAVSGAKCQVSGEKKPELSAPSSLYRTEFWRMGLWIVRFIPRSFCIAIGKFLVKLYWNLAPNRREILIQNLLPALNGERQAATDKAKALLQNFAIKVVDLWQYEAGLPVERLLGTPSGWEHYAAAQATGRGILLLTPHLGNWEFGGPWMTRRNVKLLVITLAEPGKRLTELRQKSRARWNIETVVIGNDPFAFIEIMKRLEAGATVALLVDRPPAPTAIEVELFGKPFSASVAAAELARASGCVLLPVYMPHRDNAYDAHILPPIAYDRAALRDRANRQKLTQEIMRAFEPAIKQHLDQWYHFIPIWKR
jgi:KDO2-lipid IV(A) lauroyltransferase